MFVDPKLTSVYTIERLKIQNIPSQISVSMTWNRENLPVQSVIFLPPNQELFSIHLYNVVKLIKITYMVVLFRLNYGNGLRLIIIATQLFIYKIFIAAYSWPFVITM